jgi:hypothetical protein
MDTLVFASILIIGGWAMYSVGYSHGYSAGKDVAIEQVSKRHPFRSIIYDAYDK